MDLTKYITENNVILIPVLYVVGIFFKSTPLIKDWLIPWLIVILSIIFSVALGLRANASIIDGIIQGILIAGVTVLGNQLIKQSMKKSV